MTENTKPPADLSVTTGTAERPLWTTPVVELFDAAVTVKGATGVDSDGGSPAHS